MSQVPFHIWVGAVFTLRNWRKARKAERREIIRITRDSYVVHRKG
jgi:hypothetical protein